MRRGAASSMIEDGVPLNDVCLFGRWASEASAREYIRLGQMAMLRTTRRIDRARWECFVVLARTIDRSWSLAASGGVG